MPSFYVSLCRMKIRCVADAGSSKSVCRCTWFIKYSDRCFITLLQIFLSEVGRVIFFFCCSRLAQRPRLNGRCGCLRLDSSHQSTPSGRYEGFSKMYHFMMPLNVINPSSILAERIIPESQTQNFQSKRFHIFFFFATGVPGCVVNAAC